jgi:hypothetical protein
LLSPCPKLLSPTRLLNLRFNPFVNPNQRSLESFLVNIDTMTILRSSLWALALATLASTQDDDRPYKPTVDSLLMQGTGCPIGAGGIVSGMENGIPIFKFSEWDLDLADLANATDPATGKPADTIDKFCIEQIRLGNNPPGYQVRIGKVTVGGKAMLEKGSVLGVLVETRLSEKPSGVSDFFLCGLGKKRPDWNPADLKGGNTGRRTLHRARRSQSRCI